MSEKITWTHVDAHVREAVTRAGIIYLGSTDAEVALSYISYLELKNAMLECEGKTLEQKLERTENNLNALKNRPVSKTKKRLAALEAKVEELVAWTGLER